MDIDAVFLPVAVELIDNVFPTDVTYHRESGSTYDPATGDVTASVTDIAIKAGVLSRKRTEEGGTGEVFEIVLWVHHGDTGLTELPTTSDTLTYAGRDWKVTEVAPTYSSAALIASKITARAI